MARGHNGPGSRFCGNAELLVRRFNTWIEVVEVLIRRNEFVAHCKYNLENASNASALSLFVSTLLFSNILDNSPTVELTSFRVANDGFD